MSGEWNDPSGGTLSGEEGTNVVKALWEDISENLVGYLLSGLVAFVALMVLLMPVIGVSVAAFVAGAATEDPLWVNVGLGIGGILGSFGALALMAVTALMSASLMRAIDGQRRGEGAVTWSSVFSTFSQDAVRIVLFSVLGTVAISVAFGLCILPAIPVMAVWTFATPIVVLESAGIATALGIAARHLASNLVWHVVVWLILTLIWMVLQATGIGGLFWMPILVGYQVFAYRTAFGEGGAAGMA